MRAYVVRGFGTVKGAYWAPDGAGFDAPAQADAFLGLDGQARVFAWRDITRFDRHANGGRGGMAVIGRVHDGCGADELARGSSMDPEIRAALEAAIMAAMQQDQALAQSNATHQNGPRDQWGNLISEGE